MARVLDIGCTRCLFRIWLVGIAVLSATVVGTLAFVELGFGTSHNSCRTRTTLSRWRGFFPAAIAFGLLSLLFIVAATFFFVLVPLLLVGLLLLAFLFGIVLLLL